MLGRLVDEYIVRDRARPPETVWGDVLPLLQSADRRFVNLECVISRRGYEWRPDTKAFHFRADPRAVDILRAARIDCVTLANNHILDYGEEALSECLALLDRAAIRHTGAGLNLRDALAPVFIDTDGESIAVIAVTDNEPEWEATARTPGVHFIAYDHRGLLEPYRTRVMETLRAARRSATFVVVSAHVGPNWGPPSDAMRALAHQLVQTGADLYWGHSNHTPQGIEIVDGKAILYSTGDFIDDYAVDPSERNDLSFLFSIDVQDGRARGITLLPVAIEQFCVRRATAREAAFLTNRMRSKCLAFGTSVDFHDGIGRIQLT